METQIKLSEHSVPTPFNEAAGSVALLDTIEVFIDNLPQAD